MVSDKVIVVLLILAIMLSVISTVVTLSSSVNNLQTPTKTQYVYQPAQEQGQVSIAVGPSPGEAAK